MKTIEVLDINEKIKEDAVKFVKDSEDAYYNDIEKAADIICQNDPNKKPFILISGPSGSGKTTSSIKLFNAIKKKGFNVCYISMDKYFKNFTPEEKELKIKGKIDLESPERVDKEYLDKDLTTLMNGGTIDIPNYDFSTNSRTLSGTKLSRKNGFIILEGIHALNPEVIGANDEFATRIYVSVRTRVVDPDGDRLHPCKIRLMRRMMRDKLYRQRDIEDTIKMFQSVQHGENEFILPYKRRADINIDTYIKYEPALYENYLYKDMLELQGKYAELRDICKAMDKLDCLDKDVVPKDALMREFIGGSIFKY